MTARPQPPQRTSPTLLATPLGALLHARGDSAEAMADRIGVWAVSLRRWMTGQPMPHYHVYTIARDLGLLDAIPAHYTPTQRDEAVVEAVRAFMPSTRPFPKGMRAIFARREMPTNEVAKMLGASCSHQLRAKPGDSITPELHARIVALGIPAEEIADAGIVIESRYARPGALDPADVVDEVRRGIRSLAERLATTRDNADEIKAEIATLVSALRTPSAKARTESYARAELARADKAIKAAEPKPRVHRVHSAAAKERQNERRKAKRAEARALRPPKPAPAPKVATPKPLKVATPVTPRPSQRSIERAHARPVATAPKPKPPAAPRQPVAAALHAGPPVRRMEPAFKPKPPGYVARPVVYNAPVILDRPTVTETMRRESTREQRAREAAELAEDRSAAAAFADLLKTHNNEATT